MPSISSSGSVFNRFRRQPSEIAHQRSNEEPVSVFEADESKSRLLSGHRRESSILSLPASVTDLGHNVKRSVSLRSHRTQASTSSFGHKPRYPSSGNLLTNSNTSLQSSPDKPTHPSPVEGQIQPPRSRGKLSIASRSFSQKLKSTDSLPHLSPPDRADSAPAVPPVTAVTGQQSKRTSSMLVAPQTSKRIPSDRPSLASQSSFQSFQREAPPASHGPPNGATLQPAASISQSVSGNTAGGAANPHAVYQTIHETGAKRMATIDYLRKVHEGDIFYFSTLHYTPQALSSLPSLNTHKLGRRATSYLLLGYSLPALLDLNSGSPLEYLKALSTLLSEFETYQSLSGFDSAGSSLSRSRAAQMFKTSIGLSKAAAKGRRASATAENIAMHSADAANASLLTAPPSSISEENSSPISPAGGHEFQHLLTPHLPFDPDFPTTFATLCDTLIDTYANLLQLVSGPEVCGTGVAEAFAKADKAVRKILVANVMREFEDSTRAGVKGEVAGLGRLVLGGLM